MMQSTDDMQSGGAQPRQTGQMPQRQMQSQQVQSIQRGQLGGGAQSTGGQGGEWGSSSLSHPNKQMGAGSMRRPMQQNRWGSYGRGRASQPISQSSAPIQQVQRAQQQQAGGGYQGKVGGSGGIDFPGMNNPPGAGWGDYKQSFSGIPPKENPGISASPVGMPSAGFQSSPPSSIPPSQQPAKFGSIQFVGGKPQYTDNDGGAISEADWYKANGAQHPLAMFGGIPPSTSAPQSVESATPSQYLQAQQLPSGDAPSFFGIPRYGRSLSQY